MYKEKTTTKKRKKTLSEVWFYYICPILQGLIIAALFLGFITAIGIFFIKSEKNADMKKYNNGICVQCGGEYKIFSKDITNDKAYYNYKCEHCDYIITTASQMHIQKS